MTEPKPITVHCGEGMSFEIDEMPTAKVGDYLFTGSSFGDGWRPKGQLPAAVHPREYEMLKTAFAPSRKHGKTKAAKNVKRTSRGVYTISMDEATWCLECAHHPKAPIVRCDACHAKAEAKRMKNAQPVPGMNRKQRRAEAAKDRRDGGAWLKNRGLR